MAGLFADIFRILPSPCIVVGVSGTIHSANAAGRERLGLSRETSLPDFFSLFEDGSTALRRDLTGASRAAVWHMSAAKLCDGPLAGLRQAMKLRGLPPVDGEPRVLILLDVEAGNTFREHTRLIATLNAEVARQQKLQHELEEAVAREQYLHGELIHRVKNNLSLLSSLVSFWVRETDNADVIDALRTVQLRIRSIALVHDLLDRNQTVEVVNAEELIGELCDLLTESIIPKNVTLQCEVDSLRLHNDDATTLCILINELVTNALKHAFEGRAQGLINLHFKANGVDKMELRVRDDGEGLSEVPKSGKTHGTQILNALAASLGGELSHKSSDGMEWMLAFEPKSIEDVAAE